MSNGAIGMGPQYCPTCKAYHVYGGQVCPRKAQAEKEAPKALSTSTSSGSEADTKPSGTLEENIRRIVRDITFEYGMDGVLHKTSSHHKADAAADRILSLYQKELVRELRELYLTDTDDLAYSIKERITKLTGEQP